MSYQEDISGYLWSAQVNIGMVTHLTLKSIGVHWDQFPPIKSLTAKFPVYTNYLASILLVKTDLVDTKIFQCTQCHHSRINLNIPKLTWNDFKGHNSNTHFAPFLPL